MENEESKRTTNQDLKEILNRLVQSTGEYAHHKSDMAIRVHALEGEMARRIQFEAQINKKFDELPEMIKTAVQSSMIHCPAYRQNAISSTKKEEEDKEKVFGSWEWTRSRVDNLIWALVQAAALVIAASYFSQ